MNERLRDRLIQWLAHRKWANGVVAVEGLGSVGTTVGSRPDNQDRAIIAKYDSVRRNESFLFFGLCDGIGGMRDGAMCASIALATVISELVAKSGANQPAALLNASLAANEDINRIYHEQGGSTLSSIYCGFQGFATGLNIGDSRIYRKTDELFSQVTVDDNIASQLQLLGKEQLHVNSFSKQLTQYLGVGKGLEPVVLKHFKLQGTGYLISSDGIHTLPPRLLSEFVLGAQSAEQVVTRLTSVASWRNTGDNATVICVPADLDSKLREIKWLGLGLLEIWDSFGKLDILVDANLRQDFYYRRTNPQSPKAPIGTDPILPNKPQPPEKRSKKNSPRKQKNKTEIEIVEHPPK